MHFDPDLASNWSWMHRDAMPVLRTGNKMPQLPTKILCFQVASLFMQKPKMLFFPFIVHQCKTLDCCIGTVFCVNVQIAHHTMCLSRNLVRTTMLQQHIFTFVKILHPVPCMESCNSMRTHVKNVRICKTLKILPKRKERFELASISQN